MELLPPRTLKGIFSITRKSLLVACGIAFVCIGLLMICKENWVSFPLWLRAIIGVLPWIVTMGWVMTTLHRTITPEIAEYQGLACVIGWLATLHLTEQLVLSTIPDYWVFFFFSLLLAPILLVRHSDSGFWIWVYYTTLSHLSEACFDSYAIPVGISILWNSLPLIIGYVYFLRLRREQGWQAYLRTMLYAGGIALYSSTAFPVICFSLHWFSETCMANLALAAMVTPLLAGACLERQGTLFQRPLTMMGVGALLIALQVFFVLVFCEQMTGKITYILLTTVLISATLRWTWHSVGKLLPFIPLAYILALYLPFLLIWVPLVIGTLFVIEGIHSRDRLLTNLAMVYAVLATAWNVYLYFENFTLTLGGVAMIFCGFVILGVNYYFSQLMKEAKDE